MIGVVRTRDSVLQWRSNKAVTVQGVKRLDDVIGLGRLNDVMRVGRDEEGLDEAEERWGARTLVLWLWF
jgi:hypothetical protein